MKVKQYLGQIGMYDRKIQNKLAEIYQLRTMASSISIAYDNERVQTSGNKDKIGNTVAKIADLEAEADDLVAEMVAKRTTIIKQLENLDNETYYAILHSKYVKHNMSFGQIGNEIGYSRRRIIDLHEQALTAFDEKYGSLYH